MTVAIHALWELSPFIAGFVWGILILVQHRQQSKAGIAKTSIAVGVIVTLSAGEFAGTPLVAIVSITLDSGAATVGVIVAHFFVRQIAVRRERLRQA